VRGSYRSEQSYVTRRYSRFNRQLTASSVPNHLELAPSEY